MMNAGRYIIGLWFMALVLWMTGNKVLAQSADTLLILDEVNIIEKRTSEYAIGKKCVVLDSILTKGESTLNISDVIEMQIPVFIKAYGVGTMSTSAFRGMGASHTAILWNGINLQSSMNGQSDLSLYPVSFVDEVRVQLGGAGALYGSGAVGGSIHLTDKANFNDLLNIKAMASLGSYNASHYNVGVEYSIHKYAFEFNGFHEHADNDYEFVNDTKFGAPVEKLTNAGYDRSGFKGSFFVELNKNLLISAHSWYQETERLLPPTMTTSMSVARQTDEFLRNVFKLQYKKNKYSLVTRLAYIDENIHYVDSLTQTDADNQASGFIAEVENHFNFNKYHKLNIGLTNVYETARVDDYINDPERNRSSAFASYVFTNRKESFKSVFNIRTEHTSRFSSPFLPSIGLETKLYKAFRMRFNVSKTYRIPTFNDMYWSPGGNPDLVPEEGWSADVGLSYSKDWKKQHIDLSANYFNNYISDLIVWLPATADIWVPQNIRTVWSKGVEFNFKYDLEIGWLRLKYMTAYSFTSSVNEKTEPGNEAIEGMQLIYVPDHLLRQNLILSAKGWWLIWSASYTGKRYTKSDNTAYLDPYIVGNVRIGKKFVLNSHKLDVTFKVNNVWAETYQVIEYRPMPLRNYAVQLQYNFNKIKK